MEYGDFAAPPHPIRQIAESMCYPCYLTNYLYTLYCIQYTIIGAKLTHFIKICNKYLIKLHIFCPRASRM